MRIKRGLILFIFGIVVISFFQLSSIQLIKASSANISITILEPLAAENISNWGIFEPLCCSGGTGDWCLDNNVFNETTLEGDVYCEGENAGNDIVVNIQHVLKFNFSGLTLVPADTIQCIIEQSNGSLLTVSETGLTLSNSDYILRYAISNNTNIERDESASIHDLPWGIHNCSVIYNAGGQDDVQINEVVFVRRNKDWNTFDYIKSFLAESGPSSFFNNTLALKTPSENNDESYMRSLTFKHYGGAKTEEFCFDGGDSDGNLLID